MNKSTIAAVGLALASWLIVAAPSPAAAGDDVAFPIGFTGGLGAYPRTTPQYDARTGDALPEGAEVHITCWDYGQTITNPYDYSSDVWLQDTAGLWWPEAWVDTGSTGVPAGVAACSGGVGSDDLSAGPYAEETWQPNCEPGGSWIVGSISTADTDEGLRISLEPTSAAREAWGEGLGWDSTVSMWHAVQDCVPGLYGETADSVWQQLECHQRYATITKPGGEFATGPTYDFETWVTPLAAPNDFTYALTQCLGHNDRIDAIEAALTTFATTD